jgi:hypothetical protein
MQLYQDDYTRSKAKVRAEEVSALNFLRKRPYLNPRSTDAHGTPNFSYGD